MKTEMHKSTLYICYFGLREPLVQTQVLPYLRQLVAGGVEVSLLTFEPRMKESWSAGEMVEHESRLADEGIRWSRLPYHKRPSLPATLYDIAMGARAASRLVRERGIEVLHARSHVGAAMGAAAKRLTGARLIFDIRGFMPEEYVDAGVWPEGGHLYRTAKRAERRLLDAADGFVVLTERAREILFGKNVSEEGYIDALGRPVEVIPCCVDMARFRAAEELSKGKAREELRIEAGRRVLVYVGALGGWYMTDEMADFIAAAHEQDPSTFTMILTQSPPAMMADLLKARGVGEADYLIRKVSPRDIARYLKTADIALSFIKPCYSKLSSSPTKLAEYLASGLPVVCNAGIGDVDECVTDDCVGIIVREFNRAAYLRALEEVDALRREDDIAARCRASAVNRFDLERVGGGRYRRLYRRLARKGARLQPSESVPHLPSTTVEERVFHES